MLLSFLSLFPCKPLFSLFLDQFQLPLFCLSRCAHQFPQIHTKSFAKAVFLAYIFIAFSSTHLQSTCHFPSPQLNFRLLGLIFSIPSLWLFQHYKPPIPFTSTFTCPFVKFSCKCGLVWWSLAYLIHITVTRPDNALHFWLACDNEASSKSCFVTWTLGWPWLLWLTPLVARSFSHLPLSLPLWNSWFLLHPDS